ncbi:MAG: hypothetical protein RMJ97_06215 [Raineya sp.]|nr:hypothetical protein [Raineya sp.]MDW8296468.1 hypothetical protein [Raineya sp.]
MAQDYDKILRENIEEIILPLIEYVLDLHPEKLEEIPDDLQVTLERSPDFLKKVVHSDSSKDYILHIEFQVEDSKEMIYRMLEYHAILVRKYKLPVRQYVFYIGNQIIKKMFSSLQHENFSFRYTLINLQDYDCEQFLASDIPEMSILAILANFGSQSSEQIISKILEKIKSLPIGTFHKEKCVVQLEVLANLRSLQEIVTKLVEKMALTYNLENDVRFKQGIEKGIEKGKESVWLTSIKNMLAENFPLEQIAKLLEVPLDFVRKVAENLKNNNSNS